MAGPSDLGQLPGGFTLPHGPVRRSFDPTRMTAVERAAFAALGCPPWGLGLCDGYGQLMRDYGQ